MVRAHKGPISGNSHACCPATAQLSISQQLDTSADVKISACVISEIVSMKDGGWRTRTLSPLHDIFDNFVYKFRILCEKVQK